MHTPTLPYLDMADNSPSQANENDIKCRRCGRTLGTISPTGLLAPAKTEAQSCNTCRRFEELHTGMKNADEQWEEHRHRRSNHGGRQRALEASKKAHIEFANFILQVEGNPQSTQEQGAEEQEQNEDPQQVLKRRRSSISASSPPRSPKRRRLAAEAKTVTFGDSVVLRDESEYRGSAAYHRADKNYVRGQNAAPEGREWIDTSGHQQGYGEFHEVKWAGRKWISTRNAEDEDDEKGKQYVQDEHHEEPQTGEKTERERPEELLTQGTTAIGGGEEEEETEETEEAEEGQNGTASLEDEANVRDEILLPERIKDDARPSSG